METSGGVQDASAVRVLLAGLDGVYVSADLQVSDAVYAKLAAEKEAARVAAKAGQVRCPAWLGARVLPNGDKGGYAFLVETEDFTVKVCGRHTPNRPGLYLALRSHFLHTHAFGARGACEEALCWVREQLCYDLDERLVREAVCFERVKVSRADLHVDWQGGYAPSLDHVARPRRAGSPLPDPPRQDEMGPLRRGDATHRLHLRRRPSARPPLRQDRRDGEPERRGLRRAARGAARRRLRPGRGGRLAAGVPAAARGGQGLPPPRQARPGAGGGGAGAAGGGGGAGAGRRGAGAPGDAAAPLRPPG